MYLDMLENVKRRGDLPINLRVALAAGAPCSPQLIRLINKQLKVESVRVRDRRYFLGSVTPLAFPGVFGALLDLRRRFRVRSAAKGSQSPSVQQPRRSKLVCNNANSHFHM